MSLHRLRVEDSGFRQSFTPGPHIASLPLYDREKDVLLSFVAYHAPSMFDFDFVCAELLSAEDNLYTTQTRGCRVVPHGSEGIFMGSGV